MMCSSFFLTLLLLYFSLFVIDRLIFRWWSKKKIDPSTVPSISAKWSPQRRGRSRRPESISTCLPETTRRKKAKNDAHKYCWNFPPLTITGEKLPFNLRKKYFLRTPKVTLHYKEFITENKEQFTIHDDEFSFYHFLKHNFRWNFSVMTTILLFHASSYSSDPFHSPSQHMKTENTAVYLIGITITILILSASWDWSFYIYNNTTFFSQCLHIITMDY